MSTEDPGSVTRWIDGLKAGDPEAAHALWERYFARLVRLAGAKLRARHAPGGDADEEDAALSAFDSFCAAAAVIFPGYGVPGMPGYDPAPHELTCS